MSTFIPPNLGAAGVGSITTTSGNFTNSLGQNTGILGGWAYIGDGSTPSAIIQPVVGTNLACVVRQRRHHQLLRLYQVPARSRLAYLSTIMFQSNNIMIDNSSTGDTQVAPDNAGTTNDCNTVTIQRPEGGSGAGGSYSFIIGISNVLRLGKYGAIFSQNNATGNNTWLIGEDAAGSNAGGGFQPGHSDGWRPDLQYAGRNRPR